MKILYKEPYDGKRFGLATSDSKPFFLICFSYIMQCQILNIKENKDKKRLKMKQIDSQKVIGVYIVNKYNVVKLLKTAILTKGIDRK